MTARDEPLLCRFSNHETCNSRHRLHIRTQGFSDETGRTNQLQALLVSFLGTDFIVTQAARGRPSADLTITTTHGRELPGMLCTYRDLGGPLRHMILNQPTKMRCLRWEGDTGAISPPPPIVGRLPLGLLGILGGSPLDAIAVNWP